MATITVSCHEDSYTFIQRRIIVLKEKFPFRIGRCYHKEKFASNNALFDTKNALISHNHAFFVLVDTKVHIEDYSINGTFVNGKRINKSELYEIYSGDVIQLAYAQPVIFKVRISSEADLRFKDLINEKYPHPLHFYLKPPTAHVELSLIVDKTEKRFHVLKELEKFGEKEMLKCNTNSAILNVMKDKHEDYFNLITLTFDTLESEYSCLEMENITHHILCIGFCRYSHLHHWFIKQESKLLHAKWMHFNNLEKIDLLHSYQIQYQWVDSREREKLMKEYPNFIDANLDLVKIHFSKVVNVITSKDYLLINGYVYIPLNILIMAMIVKFEALIEHKLKTINSRLDLIADEKRIYSVVNYIERQFLSSDFHPRSRVVLSNMIDQLSDQSFPLCMNILNYYLNKKHHLRNGGRFQYGLFLKGIGLPLSESLKFWKNHFTKIMDENQFNKSYSYHIRHIYGTVGKMFSYPAKNCTTILKDNPGPLDYHGCPFSTLDYNRIMFELKRNNINDNDCREIWNSMSNGLAQVACAKYFNAIHKSTEDLISHPNLYFERSQTLKLTVDCCKCGDNENNQKLCKKGCAPEW
ncbi:hypothetical protein O3M35_011906 [Rhynocoris fuscipes]|uniref:FHA domain-containing protein n=1 Tax=Rhynocoris fuscipes TaxID=488301 RepID=A0AAW1CXX1_9HEMI